MISEMIPMIRIKLIFILLISSTSIFAQIFENFKDWKKDEVSKLYSVLTNPDQKISVHISKLDSISEWKHETLEEDIKTIEIQRREVSEFFGLTEYHLSNFELDSSDENYEVLTINGSYKDLRGDIVHFREINIYYSHKGTQVKIISEEIESINKLKVQELITEIKSELKKSL